MKIKKLSVSIEPEFVFGESPVLRVGVRADGQNFEYVHPMPEDHFESLFDYCLKKAADGIKDLVRQIEARKREQDAVLAEKGVAMSALHILPQDVPAPGAVATVQGDSSLPGAGKAFLPDHMWRDFLCDHPCGTAGNEGSSHLLAEANLPAPGATPPAEESKPIKFREFF